MEWEIKCQEKALCHGQKYWAVHAYQCVWNALISMYAFTVLCTSWLFCHFDIDVCIYSTCTFLFLIVVGCQGDFDVNNVQRRELVNFYGV